MPHLRARMNLIVSPKLGPRLLVYVGASNLHQSTKKGFLPGGCPEMVNKLVPEFRFCGVMFMFNTHSSGITDNFLCNN